MAAAIFDKPLVGVAVIAHQHLGDALQFGILELRQRVARRGDFLAAAFGGLAHERNVIERLADRCHRRRRRRVDAGAWRGRCMSAAISGTSVALPGRPALDRQRRGR